MTSRTRRMVLSVKALVNAARRLLESDFSVVDVLGEVVGFTRAASGHVYWTLKDDKAQIRCMMYRTNARFLPFSPADGIQVVASGRLSVYEPRGEMQLLVDRMEPAGEGALAAAFEKMKKELAAKGYFDADRKKPLPDSPSSVGVVTSLSAAALFDTLRTLLERQPGLHIVVSPTPVQGAGAPEKIARALSDLDRNARCQVILLVRGGGSPEDLWAFNDPVVVEAVVNCETPVVTGVGHEIDLTLSDLAADFRAVTPTAAAQAVVPDHEDQQEALAGFLDRSSRAVGRRVQNESRRLDDQWTFLGRAVRRELDERRRAAEALRERLVRGDPLRRIQRDRLALAMWSRSLAASVERLVEKNKTRQALLAGKMIREAEGRLLGAKVKLEGQRARLFDLSPLAVLRRGYAIVRDAKTKKVARRARDHSPGSRLDVRLHEGELKVEVLPDSGEKSTGS